MNLIERLEAPISGPGCYSLHLYCDHTNPAHRWDEFPHEFDGEQTRYAAVREARARGWKIHRDGTATCPKCIAALKAKAQP